METFSRITKQAFSQNNKVYTYWVEGDSSNPVIVIIPGFTGTHTNFLDFAKHLKKTHFVVIPELPGWGEAPPDGFGYAMADYTEYVEKIVTHTVRKDKIIVIGHCMGATLAIEFAYLYPFLVKELFLISTPYQDGDVSHKIFKLLVNLSLFFPPRFRPIFYIWRSRALAIPLGFIIIQSRSLKKKLRIIMQNAKSQSRQIEKVVEENWGSLMYFDYSKARKITSMTHIIHGEKDLLISVKKIGKLEKLFPKVTVDIIPTAGHTPPIETPQTLAHIITSYM